MTTFPHRAKPAGKQPQSKYGSAQAISGLATLLFCLILLTSATTLIFTMARTSLAEQRIMGNEYHAESLRQASEASLHYAYAWISQHELEWQLNDSGQYQLSIPLPASNLGLDNNINIQAHALSDDIDSEFFLLQAQASQTRAIIMTTHQTRQFIHYSIIAEADRTSDTIANVITVPGTWHDF